MSARKSKYDLNPVLIDKKVSLLMGNKEERKLINELLLMALNLKKLTLKISNHLAISLGISAKTLLLQWEAFGVIPSVRPDIASILLRARIKAQRKPPAILSVPLLPEQSEASILRTGPIPQRQSRTQMSINYHRQNRWYEEDRQSRWIIYDLVKGAV